MSFEVPGLSGCEGIRKSECLFSGDGRSAE